MNLLPRFEDDFFGIFRDTVMSMSSCRCLVEIILDYQPPNTALFVRASFLIYKINAKG